MELGEVGRGFDLTARLEASGEAGLRLITAADGWDLRRKPYLLVRLPIDAGPVRLV
ncbi:hypothetical protein [Streptomyces sp. Ag82_O1-15]|uniref:hypothetical protein n=1 Tax=Streptomyces sp. Ag82_O1-15 TaxID=1938855 RepID=UPI00211B76D0|nr:hypothetical protein [Streptomyces sp. Ag82_O1-15]